MKPKEPGVSVEVLKDLLDYNPETGIISWKSGLFNNKRSGQEAGFIRKSSNYKELTINQRLYQAHRVAWALYYGTWPSTDSYIDHIDRNKQNNKIENLREVSPQQSSWNRIRERKREFPTGVRAHQNVPHGKTWYRAAIEINNKTINLGCFTSPEEAGEAYLKASKDLRKEYDPYSSPTDSPTSC